MEEIASPIFYVYPFENPFGVAWHPSMKYLAVNAYSSLYQSTIYDIHYAPTTTPQALSASMVFGDSAKGSACDAYLRLQPGASINLTGKMLYDNVN
jgi:hypothetical protein